jgi:hypothetical protein
MLLDQIIGHVVKVDDWHAIDSAVRWVMELFLLAVASWRIVKRLRFVVATGDGCFKLLD